LFQGAGANVADEVVVVPWISDGVFDWLAMDDGVIPSGAVFQAKRGISPCT